MIAAIAVVIPARDEQRLIGACLDSLRRARNHPDVSGLPVTVVVAADSCRDRTVSVARRHGADIVEVAAHSAGTTRARGTAHAMEAVSARHSELTDGQVWLAHTDADSQVPQSWLADQLAHARAGAHAVVGQVLVRDWSEHTATTAAHFTHHYVVHHHDQQTQVASAPSPGQSRSQRLHPHVHGANLGVRADAYLAVGGFPQLTVGEDRALVTALEQAHYRVLASADAPVVTSARRDPRAPGGFGHFLLDLETRTTRFQD